jgi:hypothetical protein
LGLKRFEVLAAVRAALNADRPADQQLGLAETADWLWEQYADESGVLNNLALEYLAQETPVVRDAVERLAADGFANPVKDIPERLGIDRTKAFAALANALGADGHDVLRALAAENVSAGTPTERLYLYLIRRDHVRFVLVGKHDWTQDVAFLRQLVESDAQAKAYVEQHIWQPGLLERVGTLFQKPKPGDMYERLARNPRLIQHALDRKDWTRTPEHAARLLRLNPFEARARVAAEINGAAQEATRRLWDAYQPNRGVWLPIVAVGIVATIALGVFGQMAKRWHDMNA